MVASHEAIGSRRMDRFPRICIFCRKAVGSTYSGRTRHRNYCKQQQRTSILPDRAAGISRGYTPYTNKSNRDETDWQDIDNKLDWAELDVEDSIEDDISPLRDATRESTCNTVAPSEIAVQYEWDDNVLDSADETPNQVESTTIHLRSERLSTASNIREITFEDVTGHRAGQSVPG